MKIKGNNQGKTPTSGVKTGGAGSASAGKKSKAAGDSQSTSAASTPAVSVSSTSGISERLASAGTSRAEKVAQIKLNVDAGTYEMDAQKTADKLIDSLTDYSLA